MHGFVDELQVQGHLNKVGLVMKMLDSKREGKIALKPYVQRAFAMMITLQQIWPNAILS